MTQDDWFNIIFPIVLLIGTIALIRGYYQEKHFAQELEEEHLQLQKEKDALRKEIKDFNKK